MMVEGRVQRLEEGLTEALIQNARLAGAVEHLTASVTGLSATVQDLRDSMNKGRGALAVITMAAGAIGALIMAAINKAMG